MKYTIVALLLISATAFAEDSDYSFLGAAKEYAQKAAKARRQGHNKKAAIYERMRQIKLEAHKLAEQGKQQNWDEYQALEEKLEALKEKHSTDDSFLDAAQDYAEKASDARSQGDNAKAAIYDRMRQIKLDAHKLAEQGKQQNWDEYHRLEKRLKALKRKKMGKRKFK